MARKKSRKELKDDVNLDENSEELDDEKSSKGGRFANFLIAVVVIVIWLVIFALLIKMDVGGVGTMLRPYLKNVPVISSILPEATNEEIADETGYKFNSMADAVDYIKKLEKQLSEYQNSGDSSAEKIAELQAEVERLKVFEQNQEYYDQLKDQFDREVVYNDNAPDISEYQKWYESMDPDNAAQIYAEVVERVQYSKKVQEWADAYAKMEPAAAAAILEEMTGDTDLVAKILMNMSASKRGAVLAAMDPVYAAKITKIMYP